MQQESAFETSLRDQLIAAHHGVPTEPYIVTNHADPQQGSIENGVDDSDSPLLDGLREAAGQPDTQSAPRSGRKQLRGTKRAAQNRNAQRAFRERNKTKIDSLDARLKRLRGMEEHYRFLQRQNSVMQAHIGILTKRLSLYTQDIPATPQLPADPGPDPQYADLPHDIEADAVYAQAQVQAEAQAQAAAETQAQAQTQVQEQVEGLTQSQSQTPSHTQQDYHQSCFQDHDQHPTFGQPQQHTDDQSQQQRLLQQEHHDVQAGHQYQAHHEQPHSQQYSQHDHETDLPSDVEQLELEPVHQLRQHVPGHATATVP